MCNPNNYPSGSVAMPNDIVGMPNILPSVIHLHIVATPVSNFKVTIRKKADAKNIENDILKVSGIMDFKITVRKKVDGSHNAKINFERTPKNLMEMSRQKLEWKYHYNRKKPGKFRRALELIAFPFLLFSNDKRFRQLLYMELSKSVLFKVPIIKSTCFFIGNPYTLLAALSIGFILREMRSPHPDNPWTELNKNKEKVKNFTCPFNIIFI